MTLTMRHTLTGLVLTSCAAILLAGPTGHLQADDVTFQFKTTIDASPVGGLAKAPLVVTYRFDSNLQKVAVTPDLGSYGPIQVTLQVGDQCVTGTGGILVGNNWGDGTTDGYEVEFGNTNSGQLFGLNVQFFRFLIVDSQAAMFSSTALPVSPDFAVLADFQQIGVDLENPKTGEFFRFGFSESEIMPPELKTPFTLTLIPIVDLINDLGADVLSLGLAKGLEGSLLAKLGDALQALTDANDSNDHVAVNKLEEFISEVSAKEGKQIPALAASSLIDEAEAIIEILMLLIGC